jgi:hypothetical protein
MKKTILTFAAIFIATQLFSQDVDSISTRFINTAKNKIASFNNINNSYYELANKELNLYIIGSDHNYDVQNTNIKDLYSIDLKYNFVIQGVYFIHGTCMSDLVTELLRCEDTTFFSKNMQYGIAVQKYNNIYSGIVIAITDENPKLFNKRCTQHIVLK